MIFYLTFQLCVLCVSLLLLLIVLFHINNRQIHGVENGPHLSRLEDHDLAPIAADDEPVLGQPATASVDGGVELVVAELAPRVVLTAEASQHAVAHQRHLVGIRRVASHLWDTPIIIQMDPATFSHISQWGKMATSRGIWKRTIPG